MPSQKGFYESVAMPPNQDSAGLFDLKHPELDRNNDFFK